MARPDPASPVAGRHRGTLAAADRAAKALPQDAALALFLKQCNALHTLAKEEMARPLFSALLQVPAEADLAAEAIAALASARTAASTPAELASKLRPLADRSPRLLPLNTVLTQAYPSAGRLDDAAAVATRTMQLLPDTAASAQMACADAGGLGALGRNAHRRSAAARRLQPAAQC